MYPRVNRTCAGPKKTRPNTRPQVVLLAAYYGLSVPPSLISTQQTEPRMNRPPIKLTACLGHSFLKIYIFFSRVQKLKLSNIKYLQYFPRQVNVSYMFLLFE